MILKCRKKMLADLDYLESRTTEKNTNSIIWKSLWSLQRGTHSCTYGMGWVRQYDWQRIYDLCKSLLFFWWKKYIERPGSGKNRICVSKYRFLGFLSQPSQGEGPKQKRFIDYQKITDYTITINGIQ
jgi:hypothetical protein